MASVTKLSWDLSEGEIPYDPTHRYTQSTDRKGHSAWFKTRVPTQIAAEIARVVQSGYIPEYSSAQDLVRDAIMHHLHSLSEYIDDEDLERTVTLSILYDHAMKAETERVMFTDYMKTLDANLAHLIAREEFKEVKRIVLQLQDNTLAIPVSMRAEFTDYLENKLKLV